MKFFWYFYYNINGFNKPFVVKVPKKMSNKNLKFSNLIYKVKKENRKQYKILEKNS